MGLSVYQRSTRVPGASSFKSLSKVWVNTTNLPMKLPGSSSLQNFSYTGMVGGTKTNTKDRKCLRLKIQSNQGYCVWLNKGKYLTSWCPGFQMSSPEPVESVSDSSLFLSVFVLDIMCHILKKK